MTGTEFLIASTIVSTIGQLKAGADAQTASNYNAKLLQNQADAKRLTATENAKRQARLGTKRMGTLRSIDPDKLDLLEDSAIEEELNVQTTIHSGEVDAISDENSARLELRKGKNAMTSAMMGAAGSALMGGAVAKGV